jgi:WD40 repeat protein
MKNLDALIANLQIAPPPEPAQLKEFLRIIGIDLPADYLEFLQNANGGSGEVGGRFIRLDSIKQVLENTRYHHLFSKKLLHIGSDGGEVAYCFSFKQKPGKFVSLGYHETRSRALSDSLQGMLEALAQSNAAPAETLKKAAKSAGKSKAPVSAPRKPIEGLKYEFKHRGAVIAMAVSPDGKRLVTADDDNHTYLWDLETGQRLSATNHARSCHRGTSFNADGSLALLLIDKDPSHVNRTLVVFDQVSERPVSEIETDFATGGNGAISPDGSLALFFRPHDMQAFWNVTTGQRIAELPRQSNVPFALAFARDAQSFALGCGNYVHEPGQSLSERVENLAGSVMAFDRSGAKLGAFRAHEGPVVALAFASDGRLLTATKDQVRIWSARPWQQDEARPLMQIAVPLQMVYGGNLRRRRAKDSCRNLRRRFADL